METNRVVYEISWTSIQPDDTNELSTAILWKMLNNQNEFEYGNRVKPQISKSKFYMLYAGLIVESSNSF